MKKLFGFIFVLLLLYVIYIDLTVGTLPNTSAENASVELKTLAKPVTGISSFKEKVEPGQTVISIVENHIEKPIPVPITELVQDFRELNSGQSPEKIQIGATYIFPDYSKK